MGIPMPTLTMRRENWRRHAGSSWASEIGINAREPRGRGTQRGTSWCSCNRSGRRHPRKSLARISPTSSRSLPSASNQDESNHTEYPASSRLWKRGLVWVVVRVEQRQVLEVNEPVVVEIALEPVTPAGHAVVEVRVEDTEVLEVDEAVEVQVANPGELDEDRR